MSALVCYKVFACLSASSLASIVKFVVKKRSYVVYVQAFRFMVGLGHWPMIAKYGPSLSKAVGPVDPSFLVLKKSHFNKNMYLTVSMNYEKLLITNGS